MLLSRLNIVSLQRKDHARMEELLRRYETHSSDRFRVYAKIVQLVTTHAFAEETVLFPAARRLLHPTDELTRDIEAKHQQINELMIEMQELEPGDAGFDGRAEKLFSRLRADAREEEDRLLTALAAATDERHLQSIGAAWAAARFTAPNRPHPRVSRRPPGNILAGLPLAIIDRARRLFERSERKRIQRAAAPLIPHPPRAFRAGVRSAASDELNAKHIECAAILLDVCGANSSRAAPGEVRRVAKICPFNVCIERLARGERLCKWGAGSGVDARIYNYRKCCRSACL